MMSHVVQNIPEQNMKQEASRRSSMGIEWGHCLQTASTLKLAQSKFDWHSATHARNSGDAFIGIAYCKAKHGCQKPCAFAAGASPCSGRHQAKTEALGYHTGFNFYFTVVQGAEPAARCTLEASSTLCHHIAS